MGLKLSNRWLIGRCRKHFIRSVLYYFTFLKTLKLFQKSTNGKKCMFQAVSGSDLIPLQKNILWESLSILNTTAWIRVTQINRPFLTFFDLMSSSVCTLYSHVIWSFLHFLGHPRLSGTLQAIDPKPLLIAS